MVIEAARFASCTSQVSASIHPHFPFVFLPFNEAQLTLSGLRHGKEKDGKGMEERVLEKLGYETEEAGQ